MSDTTATRCFLRRIYDVSFISDIHSPILSDELPGKGGTTVTELRLELALVKSAMCKTLKWDYLIDTIEAIFSDDPEAVLAVCQHLSAKTRCTFSRGHDAIERVKMMSHDGLAEVSPKNATEKILIEWLDFALSVIDIEARERGWV